MSLTAAQIRSATPQAVPYELTDGGGLVVRVWPSGTKTWCLYHRDHGRSRRVTIGRFPAVGPEWARKERRRLLALAAGADDLTLRSFTPIYIERWAKPEKRSWRYDQQLLERHVLDTKVVPRGRRRPVPIGDRPLAQLTRAECAQVTDQIIDRGAPDMAARVHACLRRVLQFAVEREVIDANPAARMGRRQRRPRDRVLGAQEIADWWPHVVARVPPAPRIALGLVLATCQRLDEVLRAEAREIDRIDRIWTVPGTKAKNGITHVVPLAPQALALVDEACARWPDSACLVPCAADTVRGWMARTVEAAGLDRATPHDLRRTGATELGGLGYDRTVQDKILNHKDRSTSGIYDRYLYLDERRAALEAWDTRLSETLGVHLSFTCGDTDAVA